MVLNVLSILCIIATAKCSKTYTLKNVLQIIFENTKFMSLIIFGDGELSQVLVYPQIRLDYGNMDTLPIQINSNFLVLLFLKNLDDLETVATSLEGRFNSKVLVIPDKQSEEDIFQKCRHLHLENVVVFGNNAFFTYTPYINPTRLKTVQVDDLFRKEEFINFDNKLLTIEDDEPWNSCFYDYCQLIKKEFARRFRVNVTVSRRNQTKEPTIIMNSWKLIDGYEYPMFHEHGKVTVILPTDQKSYKFYYYILPFDGMVWLFVVLMTCFLALILSMMDCLKCARFHVIKNFLIAVEITICSRGIHSKNVSFLENIIFLLMLAYSVIVSTIYVASIGSYFMSDVSFSFKSSLIAPPDYVNSLSREINNLFNIQTIPLDKFFAKIYALDTNFGYCISSTMWMKQYGFQMTLKKYVFLRVRKWDGGYYPRTFLIRQKSIFLDRLNYFQLQAISVGLMGKWGTEMTIRNYSRKLVAFDVSNEESTVSLENDLVLVVILYVVTLSICILVFFVEFLIRTKH